MSADLLKIGAVAGALFWGGAGYALADRLYICSGYGCAYKKSLQLGPADKRRFMAIMDSGKVSAKAERKAISQAVRYFERRGSVAIGVKDGAKSSPDGGRVLGQMDCIDESRNTHSLLTYLEKHGLLRHHGVAANVSRGMFFDARYPHSTAVIREKNGGKWAVDSWYEPAGGAPDIMPLSAWMKRGVMGGR